MRTFIIGDVHGCIDEFRELVAMARPEDRVVQVGDLMDRGPAPAECVRFARECGIEVILGNHDEKHLRWRRREDARKIRGIPNAMRPFPPEVAAQNEMLSPEDIAWLTARPLWLDVAPGWRAVHAGFEPGVPMEKQRPEKVIRVRFVDPETGEMVSLEEGNADQPVGSVRWHSMWEGPNVVFGHAVQGRTPVTYMTNGTPPWCVGIDTGCCYGGSLTALILEEGREPTFASVIARRAYYTQHVPKELR